MNARDLGFMAEACYDALASLDDNPDTQRCLRWTAQQLDDAAQVAAAPRGFRPFRLLDAEPDPREVPA